MRARQWDRIYEAILRQRGAPQPLEFGVQKAPVEFGIVSDNRCVAKKLHQPVDDIGMGKGLLVAEKVVREASDAHRGFAQGAFRVDVDLKFAAGFDVVVEFYTSDFDDSFAVARLESCGFGIECDFPHASSVSPALSSDCLSALRTSSTCTPA